VGTEFHKQLIERLYDEFTYNHSFSNLITEDNVLKYWKISEYINQTIPELNFYKVRDGIIIDEFKQDIDGLNALKPLIRMVEKECYWSNVESIPKTIEFEYKYPNGSNGDMIKYIFEKSTSYELREYLNTIYTFKEVDDKKVFVDLICDTKYISIVDSIPFKMSILDKIKDPGLNRKFGRTWKKHWDGRI
jgi:hypothetical protein